MEGEDPGRLPGGGRWADLPQLPLADGLWPPGLAKSDIHLWLIHLAAGEEALSACAAVLAPDETARAARFRFQHLRDRYTVRRGAVRGILGSYLEIAPDALRFHYSAEGKPSLAGASHLSFNISHSQDLALLAVARDCRVGLDLEHREAKRDLDEIAARNFSRKEAAAIASLPGGERTDAFYACWTLKEAYVKAMGDGLSTPLDSFEVQFPPVAPTSLGRIGSSPDEHLRWRAYSFTLGEWAAAVVVEGEQHSIRRAAWNSRAY